MDHWEKSEPERNLHSVVVSSGRPTDELVLGISDTMYVEFSAQDPTCMKCSIHFSNEEE